MNNYKGIDILIDSWYRISLEKYENIKLVIAGRGNIDFSKIEKLKNVIIINKFLSEEELNEILEETDIAILPYRKISQSGVLLSVLNKNIPVIVSDVGGLTQPFEIGKVGWIVNEINSYRLQEVIENILENKSAIQSIKNDKELWENIRKYYSWEKIGRETLNLYEEVLKVIKK